MSETYTGWDGKEYPWPPPEGWHKAIDGRWWAYGTGPNPPPQGAGIQQAPGPAGSEGAAAADPALHDPTQITDRTSQLPSYEQDPAIAGGATVVAGPGGAFAPPSGTPSAGAPPPGQSGFGQPGFGQDPPSNQTANLGFEGAPPTTGPGGPVPFEPAKKRGGIGQALLIVGAMVVAALAGGLAFFYLTSRSDNLAAGDDTEESAEVSVTPSTAAPDGTDPDSDPDADGDQTDDGTTAQDETTTTTEAATSESTDPDPDATSDTSDTTLAPDQDPAPGDDLGRFRSILADNGLTSDNLADDDIRSFAQSFCGMADDAANPGEFDGIRESAVEATESGLSDDDLRLIIDAAIASFCPETAARVGIDL